MAPQPLRPGAGSAGRLLGPLRRASSLLAWTGKGSGGGCPNQCQCQSQACFMNLNFLLPCREAGVRRRWLVPGAPSGWGLCLYCGGGGYQLAWWERECLPPPKPRPPIGVSCPAAALSHSLPADQSPLAAPHPAQWPLLHPAGCWSGLWAPWLVSEKRGVAVPCGQPLPGSLSLQLDSLFPPTFSAPTFSIPTPSSSHAYSPLQNMNGLPVWPCRPG